LLLTGPGGASTRGEEGKKVERTITVSGEGKVSAAPDVADINIGVVSQATTAKDALAANTEAMTKIQSVLKERGVAAKDIQTTNISVQPQYSQPPQGRPGRQPEPFVPKIVAYQVINTVQITARDLDKLGTILDAVVQSGANQMNGISFRIEEPEKLLDGARKEAMANAKHKAELLAGESGVVVGPPISIQESGGIMPPPRPMMGGYARGEMMMAAAPVPVAAGEQELSVSVTVVYELQPAK
jgi:uncharacterized protein YggE